MQLSIDHTLPIIFGVLTTDNVNKQKKEAVFLKVNPHQITLNKTTKGTEFARSLIHMLEVFKSQ